MMDGISPGGVMDIEPAPCGDGMIRAEEVARILNVKAKHMMGMVYDEWIPKPVKETSPRAWDRNEVESWAEAHRDWVDEKDPHERRYIRMRYTGAKSGSKPVEPSDGRLASRHILPMIRVSSLQQLMPLVNRGAFPQPDLDGTYDAAEVNEWCERNRLWIAANYGSMRKRIGIDWGKSKSAAMRAAERDSQRRTVGRPTNTHTETDCHSKEDAMSKEIDDVEEESVEEEEEELDEESDEEDEVEEDDELEETSDPVAAIQSIAMEAIAAIRNIVMERER